MTDAIVDAAAVADALEAAASSTGDNQRQRSQDPPPPLPRGWLKKESRSGPGYFYYYNMETGMSTWDSPAAASNTTTTIESAEQVADRLMGAVGGGAGGGGAVAGPSPSRKQKEIAAGNNNDGDDDRKESKRPRKDNDAPSSSAPKEVRILHILKKHRGSKRPASWRNPKITQTKEEAHEELEGLLEILQEEEGDLKELRATFQELARTESDCSSAKRGGDLGFFGRKKMQPPFEDASFRLKIGEMTKAIVDTKSGSHILLRIG